MSKQEEEIEEIPSELGPQLVDILYTNTQLNYDVCAQNLIQVFRHLNQKLPRLERLSTHLIKTIKDSIENPDWNPDLLSLDENFECLDQLSRDLQNGEINFYECNERIEESLNQLNKLISSQSNPDIFKEKLIMKRSSILNLVEIWQLSTNHQLKNKIIKLFNFSFKSDRSLCALLFESTNLASELCLYIKEAFTLANFSFLIESFRCLITMLRNTQNVSLKYQEFLKSSDFIEFIFKTIESEESHLFTKLKDLDNYQTTSQHAFEKSYTLVDLFVHFLLCLNKKFIMPDENLLSKFIISNLDSLNFKFLSETLINLFNLEVDPLVNYALDNQTIEYFYSNPILKFISDLFSWNQTRNSTCIFYSNDFNVLIDIIIRKLSNLSAYDQVRVDYLSLIQLIIKNSNYIESMYRKDDLLECFHTILNEKDQDTIDQDIVRLTLTENPSLVFS